MRIQIEVNGDKLVVTLLSSDEEGRECIESQDYVMIKDLIDACK